MTRTETVILSALLHNEEYLRKVLPFLKAEYFLNTADAFLFNTIRGFAEKYNKTPTIDVLKISIEKDTALTEADHSELLETLDALHEEENDLTWLVDETERFCKEKAIYNAIYTGIKILDGKSKKYKPDALPQLFEEALSVGFDYNVGHDYTEDASARFDYYHKVENRIPCDLEFLNKITKGGVPRKTLNVLMAGVNVGKTLAMCHLASAYLMQGLNVGYITLEVSQEEIAKRVDVNTLDITFDDLMAIDRSMFDARIEKVRKRTKGRLLVKEFPTASAHAGHFAALLNEWRMKKGFVPDVLFIDYLNICASSRLSGGSAENTYTYVKAIAEEIRGLAVKYNIVVWSATQTTRTGSVSSDVDMTDVAESFGLPATADFMLALMQPEQFALLNQYLAKQLKNRYENKQKLPRFAIGVDPDRQRLYDVERSAQEGVIVDKPTATMRRASSKFEGRDFSKIQV